MMDSRATDPRLWQALIALAFAALVLTGLGTPSKMYFDEVHYVPAARALLAHMPANPEHPLLAKEAMALAMATLGDTPFAWRLPSAIMGIIGLYAFGRALWWATGRRVAALAGMVLLASDFAWFVQSRIAMLDMVMASFTMVALWMLARAQATREPAVQRLALAASGLAFGLALAAKWSALPVFALALGGIIALRWSRGGAVLPGLALSEIAAWLGAWPLIIYALTFYPAFHYLHNPIAPSDLLHWQRNMLELQESVVKHHPYQSVWWQWVANWRSIWFLYENVDGAQRGIVLIGNPLTMLLGVLALGRCVMLGLIRGCWPELAVAALYLASLALWIVGHKPVQFYYHYLLPGTFLMAALALCVDEMCHAGQRVQREAIGLLLLSLALFAWFWPILSASPLHKGAASFEDWMWLSTWR